MLGLGYGSLEVSNLPCSSIFQRKQVNLKQIVNFRFKSPFWSTARFSQVISTVRL